MKRKFSLSAIYLRIYSNMTSLYVEFTELPLYSSLYYCDHVVLSFLIIVSFTRRDAATPEDIEYYNCQQEMMEDLLQSYRFVDRIISKFDDLLM